MIVCPACGAENPPGQQFCGSCGAPLVREGLRRQRKIVTVVFCDVVGSTVLAESADPEAVEVMLARYFDRMRAIVEAHGGTVEKFIGDAVVAVFGVPVAHEDDGLRALRASVEMRDALPELGIEARIGINTGEVVTSGRDTIVTGDAINVAARLQQAAAPGEILVGAHTIALSRGAATAEKLEPLSLRGKSAPVDAFRLTGVGRTVDPGHGARFVGRVRELALLRGMWRRALLESRCDLVTIVGDPGVGKSRLVEELIADLGVRASRGRCLSYGDGITYFPIVEVIKELGAVPDDAAAVSALGSLLGDLPVTTSVEEIAWAFRKLLEQTAPLLVVFDDIQWGEEVFLDLVEQLALRSTNAQLLIICLARPELVDRRPAWPLTLKLNPLTSAETDALLSDNNLGDSLRLRIAQASGGNPLFVTEMLAVAAEAGDAVEVPPTLRALVSARVDQLENTERSVLQWGAVEGELFHRGTVQALAPSGASLTPQLTTLIRKELIRPDRPLFDADKAFRFSHLLVRDAAYEALPKATRAELHERFASWLEQHGASLVQCDEIAGYHLEQAYRYRTQLGLDDEYSRALAERAAALLIAAGRVGRRRGDYHAAAQFLTRAAELSGDDRAALLPDLGELLFELGEFSEARAVLDEALADGDAGTVAVAAIWRAIVAGHSGEREAKLAQIIDRCREAIPILENAGDESRLATVLAVDGHHRYFVGRMQEAIDLLERARILARRGNDLHRARRCLILTLAAMSRGPTPVSKVQSLIERIEREAWPELIPLTLVRLRRYRALMYGFSGRIEAARDDYEEARQLASEFGVPFLDALVGTSLGQSELINGFPERAESVLKLEYDRLEEYGETGYRSSVAALLAASILAQRRHEDAAETAELALALAEPDDVDPQVRARTVLAQVMAERGEFADARTLAREAADVAATTEYVALRGDSLVALAEVLRVGGLNAESRAALQQALSLFEQKEIIIQAEHTRTLLAEATR